MSRRRGNDGANRCGDSGDGDPGNRIALDSMSEQAKPRSEKWTTASLCIYSETISPEEITARMGVPASRSHQKGQPVSSRTPSVLRRESNWILVSPLEDTQDLASHLRWLADIIEPRIEVLRALLPKCKIKLFCGFSSDSGQGGTVLDSALLARLGKLPMDLTLDLYPPGPIAPDEDKV
jgi:hypothetical protein